MKNHVWELLFPKKCIVCHRILSGAVSTGMCETCRRTIALITEPRCKRCSRPVSYMDVELCEDCRGRAFCVEKGMALYSYDAHMKKAIRNFKYEGELSVGVYFAEKMVCVYGAWIRSIAPDAVIPVPIHKNRRRFRGFNQAEYMAEIVGRELGIPVPKEYLVRTEDTVPQKNLDMRGRMQNLRKSFGVLDFRQTYPTVLLLDDIYTTGATLEACAMALKEAGTEQIFFLCACIGTQ